MKYEDNVQLLEKETAGDKSDEIIRFKLTCEAGLPTKEKKAELWKWYLNESATESDKMFEASMSGFWNWQQLDVLNEYVDKFFDCIIDVCKKRTTHYSGAFFNYLSPGIADAHILKHFEEILAKMPKEYKARRDNAEAAIEDQKRLLKSYELCKKFYADKK